MEISERIYEGARAKEVLDNPSFQWAFDEIKREVTEQWQQSPARDSEGREKLWLMLQIAQKLQAVLTTTLETGKLAEIELQHQRTLEDRVKDGIWN